ncbi:MAG: hypothetical protein ACOYON_14370 [Fimbriimonas sp.]
MTQIRENIWLVTHSEIGKPMDTGYAKVPGTTGELLIDAADVRYIREYIERGYEPSFFISKTPALRNGYVVVSRQRC